MFLKKVPKWTKSMKMFGHHANSKKIQKHKGRNISSFCGALLVGPSSHSFNNLLKSTYDKNDSMKICYYLGSHLIN